MLPNQCLIVNDILWSTILSRSPTLCSLIAFDLIERVKVVLIYSKGSYFFRFPLWEQEFDPVVGILSLCACVLVCREINQYVRINGVACVSLCKIRQHAYGPSVPFQPSILAVHYLCSKYGIILNRFHFHSTSDADEWTLDKHSVNAINILSYVADKHENLQVTKINCPITSGGAPNILGNFKFNLTSSPVNISARTLWLAFSHTHKCVRGSIK